MSTYPCMGVPSISSEEGKRILDMFTRLHDGWRHKGHDKECKYDESSYSYPVAKFLKGVPAPIDGKWDGVYQFVAFPHGLMSGYGHDDCEGHISFDWDTHFYLKPGESAGHVALLLNT